MIWDWNSMIMEDQNITKVSKNPKQNNSKTATNENDKETLKKKI